MKRVLYIVTARETESEVKSRFGVVAKLQATIAILATDIKNKFPVVEIRTIEIAYLVISMPENGHKVLSADIERNCNCDIALLDEPADPDKPVHC